MKKYKDINIDLKDRSYKILINDNIEDILFNVVSKIITRPKVFVITDENVAGFVLPTIRKILDDGGIETQVVIIPSGEKSKSFSQLENLIKELLNLMKDDTKWVEMRVNLQKLAKPDADERIVDEVFKLIKKG